MAPVGTGRGILLSVLKGFAASMMVIAAVVALPAPAIAHRVATGATKRAILKALGPINDGHNCANESHPAVACWKVLISSNWASAEDTGPGNDGAAEWINLVHRVGGRWRRDGGWGEGIGVACSKHHVPVSVVHDLHVHCS
jgi:hypothetical protein